jgi:hypothetical protein
MTQWWSDGVGTLKVSVCFTALSLCMVLSQFISEEASLRPISQRRSNSNLPTLSHSGHIRRRSVDNSLLDSPPPVPRVPPAYVTAPKPHTAIPSEREVLPSPPSSFPSSRRQRS